MFKRIALAGLALVMLASPLITSSAQSLVPGGIYIAPVSSQSISDLQAQIQFLMAQIKVLQEQNSGSGSASPVPQGPYIPPYQSDSGYYEAPRLSLAPFCVSIRYNIGYRATDQNTGGEVSLLQSFLQDGGYLNSDPTGFFGRLTQDAVARYQRDVKILDATGFVGPLTRSKISEATCGGLEVYPSPAATFSAYPTYGDAPLLVTFNTNTDGSGLTIDYGNGVQSPFVNGQQYSYTSSGRYVATLAQRLELPNNCAVVTGTETRCLTTAASQGVVGRVIIEVSDRNVTQPQVVNEAKAKLANKLGISVSSVHVISVEKVHWNNGCLGVDPGPNMHCTQAIVDGYAIVLGVNTQRYVYNTNSDGSRIVEVISPPTTSVPIVKVISPNGGGYWYRGQTALVEWKTNAIPSDTQMLIRLRSIDTNTEYNLASVANNGTYRLTVPSAVPVGQYNIEIKASVGGVSYVDSSDSYFKVVDAATGLLPVINSISPTSGQIGSTVTIYGSGFTSVGTTVLLNGSNIGTTNAGIINAYVVSTNSNVLTFKIPNALVSGCEKPVFGYPCDQIATPVTSGTYSLLVKNDNGSSNTAKLTVTSGVSTQAPTITVNRSNRTLTQGQSMTTSWSTTGATSLSLACTGYRNPSQSNLELQKAPYTYTWDETYYTHLFQGQYSCLWTATGPGGTGTFRDDFNIVVPVPTVGPIAYLTINGVRNIILQVGQANTKTWSSTGGTSWSSTYSWAQSGSGSSCSRAGTSGAWNANTASGSESVVPSADMSGCTATITYTVRNAAGQSASDTITVTVIPALPTQTASLTSNNSRDLTVSTGAPITHQWHSTGGTSWSSTYAISGCAQAVGPTSWLANSASGSQHGNVSPGYEGCTWTLNYTVTGPGGTATDRVVIRVNPAAAPSASITQSVASTVSGQPYTVSWGSTNATSCTVRYTGPDGGGTIASGPTSGGPVTYTTSIVGTYTATNTCNSASGATASQSITHTVTAPATSAPTITVNRSNRTLTQGQSMTTSWSTIGATSLSLACTGYRSPSQSNLELQKAPYTYTWDETYYTHLFQGQYSCLWTATGPGGTGTFRDDFNIVAPAATPAPTATLTTNNSRNLSVNTGQWIFHLWNSTNGTSWSSTYTVSGCAQAGGPYPWNANSANGSEFAPVSAGYDGCTFILNYTVTGPGGTATDRVDIKINPMFTAAPQTANQLAGAAGALGSSSATQNTFPPSGSATTLNYTFTLDLYRGQSGAEVSALQQALKAEGLFAGEITGNFYDQTREAVIAFQTKYGISTTGYVGPATREKLNELYSG